MLHASPTTSYIQQLRELMECIWDSPGYTNQVHILKSRSYFEQEGSFGAFTLAYETFNANRNKKRNKREQIGNSKT